MRILICLNKPANPCISALNEETMRVLSEQYDVVVNELMKTDLLSDQPEFYWAHLAIDSKELAQRIQSLLESHNIEYKIIGPNLYSWQLGKVGLSVYQKAERFATALTAVNANITYYNGPSGHPK